MTKRPSRTRTLSLATFLVTFRVTFRVTLLALLTPVAGFAGAVLDADNDLVPDQFDSCVNHANGPNQASNQIDTDLDGYGDRCDPDVDQSCSVTALDFGSWLTCFGSYCNEADFDNSGTVTAIDFGVFLSFFGQPPGPSGLACADCTIRVDQGGVPCLP